MNIKVSKEVVDQINVTQLDEIIFKGNFNLIDVRNPEDIEARGAIPGAINIPYETIDHAIDKNSHDYHAVFDSSKPFLFCCTGGVMSYLAAMKAKESGINEVYNLEGGHSAWAKLEQELVLN